MNWVKLIEQEPETGKQILVYFESGKIVRGVFYVIKLVELAPNYNYLSVGSYKFVDNELPIKTFLQYGKQIDLDEDLLQTKITHWTYFELPRIE